MRSDLAYDHYRAALPLDAHVDAGLTLSPDEVRQRLEDLNRATYLQRCSTADLAAMIGAIQAECVCRGIQASVPLCEAQARIEAAPERESRTVSVS